MGSWKALGLDGIPAVLFQKCWDTMGQTVIQATLSFLRTCYILKELNNTFITLVPKSLNPKKVSEYRPINLCNVAYKIAAKVLANRLKLIIDELITPHQNAFIKGRLITDNIILTHELLHTIKREKKEGRVRFATLKLDLSKAYDRLNWYLIEATLQKLGFSQQWILVMQCHHSNI